MVQKDQNLRLDGEAKPVLSYRTAPASRARRHWQEAALLIALSVGLLWLMAMGCEVVGRIWGWPTGWP